VHFARTRLSGQIVAGVIVKAGKEVIDFVLVLAAHLAGSDSFIALREEGLIRYQVVKTNGGPSYDEWPAVEFVGRMAAFHLTRARVGQIIKPLVDAGLVIREGQTRATSYRLA